MIVLRTLILLIMVLCIGLPSNAQDPKYQRRGYGQSIDAGVGIRSGSPYIYGSESLFINYRAGYRFNSVVFGGIELGYLKYTRSSIYHKFPKEMLSFGVIPIEVTYGKKEWKKFFSLLVGTAYDLEDKLKNNGARAGIQFGFKKPLLNKFLLKGSVAYEHHSLYIVERDPYIDWEGGGNFSRNSFKFLVGIQF